MAPDALAGDAAGLPGAQGAAAAHAEALPEVLSNSGAAAEVRHDGTGAAAIVDATTPSSARGAGGGHGGAGRDVPPSQRSPRRSSTRLAERGPSREDAKAHAAALPVPRPNARRRAGPRGPKLKRGGTKRKREQRRYERERKHERKRKREWDARECDCAA